MLRVLLLAAVATALGQHAADDLNSGSSTDAAYANATLMAELAALEPPGTERLQPLQLVTTGYVSPSAVVWMPNNKILMLERLFIASGASSGTRGPWHSQEFDPSTNFVRPLTLPQNAWCAGGVVSPEPSGRVISFGGYDRASVANIMDFVPCGAPGQPGTCGWRALNSYVTLKQARWYPTALPLPSGRILVLGGSLYGGSLQYAAGTAEFIPARAQESLVNVPLLESIIARGISPMYPFAHVLPTGTLFIFNWDSAHVVSAETLQPITFLPTLPGGARSYPQAGTSVLLPLLAADNYTARVLVCGGQAVASVTNPATQSCGLIEPLRPKAAWALEQMPIPRVMPDSILLPDGTVYICNGGVAGLAPYGGSRSPAYQSVVYDPKLPLGQRFSIVAITNIARLYHSGASLMPDGSVLLSGSHGQFNAWRVPPPGTFPDEKRMERYLPSYMSPGVARPTWVSLASAQWSYASAVGFEATIPSGNLSAVSAMLSCNGYVTHSFAQGQRMIELVVTPAGSPSSFSLMTPPNANLMPPGWYQLWVLDNSIPSVSRWVQLGGDPANLAAWPPGVRVARPLGLESNTSAVPEPPPRQPLFWGTL